MNAAPGLQTVDHLQAESTVPALPPLRAALLVCGHAD
jgi:hypothetical protein